MFTASPVTSVVAPSPVTTSPVLTPIRMPSPSGTAASRISTAACTARKASSSWAAGTPKTAITASPTNFSTVPPARSTGVRMASNQRVITARRASGSSRSPSSVEPATSQKSTVTVFRITAAAEAMAHSLALRGEDG